MDDFSWCRLLHRPGMQTGDGVAAHVDQGAGQMDGHHSHSTVDHVPSNTRSNMFFVGLVVGTRHHL
jgi:hypothetical protein